MEKQLPIFVYGTLKEGEHNFRLLEGRLDGVETAELRGFEMYSVHGMFPAIMEGKGAVKGQLIYIHPELYHKVMRKVDRLEGYSENNPGASMYVRKQVFVINSEGNTEPAWVYIWNRKAPGKKIPSGEW